MMTLLTNLTSSLSAAADSSDSSLLPSSMGPPSMSAQHLVDGGAIHRCAKELCKRFFELSMGGYAVTELWLSWKNLWNDARAPHGFRVHTHHPRPSGDSSSGIQPCSSMNSRLSEPCNASARMRLELKGSYATPKTLLATGQSVMA